MARVRVRTASSGETFPGTDEIPTCAPYLPCARISRGRCSLLRMWAGTYPVMALGLPSPNRVSSLVSHPSSTSVQSGGTVCEPGTVALKQ
jgi:hypothetical protein